MGLWGASMLLGLLACGARERRETAMPTSWTAARAEALARIEDPRCRERIDRAWRGEAPITDECREAQRALERQLDARAPSVRWGVVGVVRATPLGLSLALSVAESCRTWPRVDGDPRPPAPAEARRAGCEMRPYRGLVEVWGVDRRRQGPAPSSTEASRGDATLPDATRARDGRVLLLEVTVDAIFAIDLELLEGLSLAADGRDLWARDAVEVGRDAWAGMLAIDELEADLAQWYADQVRRGRGSAALAAHRHPTQPSTSELKARAAEDALAQQTEDYRAVAAGRLSWRTFLARWPGSPFRASVVGLAADRETDAD